MELVRANTNFCSKAKLFPVAETCRCIPEHGRRVDLVEKALCEIGVSGHDAVTVTRAERVDVIDGVINRLYGLHGKNESKVGRSLVVLRTLLHLSR